MSFTTQHERERERARDIERGVGVGKNGQASEKMAAKGTQQGILASIDFLLQKKLKLKISSFKNDKAFVSVYLCFPTCQCFVQWDFN